MAIPFLNNINLDDNQLLNAKLHVTSSAPTAAAGQIYFDSTASVTTAKYYDGSAWISLVDHTFNNGTFINLTEAGTDATRTLTADLSATGTPDATKYLRGDNAWEPITSIPGTYAFSVSADTGGEQAINSGNTLVIAGGTNIGTVLGGVDTITVNLDDSIDLAGTLTVSGTGQSSFAGQVTIPTTPSASTDAASKAYVDASVAGGLVYQGGYNAATNTPDLDSSPSSSIEKGWTYTVTADGSFFTEQVRVGDVLISEVNSPTALADWTTVQNNIDLASSTQIGIGNVVQSTATDKTGIDVSYSGGTATVGFNIDDITEVSELTSPSDSYIPFWNESLGANERISTVNLSTELSGLTSEAFTITDTATVTHSLNTRDVIIQLYDITTNETVYADVDRISTSQATITFATTPTNSIRVLVQKIG